MFNWSSAAPYVGVDASYELCGIINTSQKSYIDLTFGQQHVVSVSLLFSCGRKSGRISYSDFISFYFISSLGWPFHFYFA
jgi:hypothetical protein